MIHNHPFTIPIKKSYMVSDLLNRKEVAEYFSVKVNTVKKWQQNGKIKPFCRLNGRPRYKLEGLTHLLIILNENNGK